MLHFLFCDLPEWSRLPARLPSNVDIAPALSNCQHDSLFHISPYEFFATCNRGFGKPEPIMITRAYDKREAPQTSATSFIDCIAMGEAADPCGHPHRRKGPMKSTRLTEKNWLTNDEFC